MIGNRLLNERKVYMYSEEIFIKLTENHMRRCYRAIVLTEKMIDLYRRRTDINTNLYPEDVEDEFYNIMEEYLKGGDNS